MAQKNSHIVFKHDSNTIISVYSELLKNKVGDFLYDPNLTINLIQKEKLASFNNINHLKIYIVHNATLTTSGVIKIPILKQEIEFNIINPEIGTGISGVIGKSFPTLFKINIPDKV